MPFDRLVKAIDQWAGEHARDDVYAQIGQSQYRPSHIEWTHFLSPEEFKNKYAAASVIVAHAGTGSIITALQLGKPILIMPRHASLRETRNDHQIATSEQFRRFDSVFVAWDEKDLREKMYNINELHAKSQGVKAYASSELIGAIKEFINGSNPANRS